MSPKWFFPSATNLHAVLKLNEPPHYAFIQLPVNLFPLVPNITTLF